MQRSNFSRTAVVLLAVVVAIAGFALSTSADSSSDVEPSPDRAGLASLPDRAEVLVRSVEAARPRRDGAVFKLSSDGSSERAGDLRCKRVAANANGAGICLALHENGIEYEAIVFGPDYEERARAFADGVPDRARVSPDGRYAGYTSFDSDQAQAYFVSDSKFTTYTRILDMRNGKLLLRLEDLEVMRDGKPVRGGKANFWGVTFTDDGRFYATMAVRGEHYLIKGTVGETTARVVGDHVECPALSPDGQRIAYKRRIGASNKWRFHVRDLRTGRDTALAEPRSIDDQPDWLGDELVVYSDDRTTFAVPADGSGSPLRLAGKATSPTLIGP